MNVNGSVMNCRQASPSSCPKRALGILTSPFPFRHGTAGCVKKRGEGGNNRSAEENRCTTAERPNILESSSKHRPCQEPSPGAWFMSHGGTWGLIQSSELVSHTVLDNWRQERQTMRGQNRSDWKTQQISAPSLFPPMLKFTSGTWIYAKKKIKLAASRWQQTTHQKENHLLACQTSTATDWPFEERRLCKYVCKLLVYEKCTQIHRLI